MSTEANNVQTIAKLNSGDHTRYVQLAQGIAAIGVWWALAKTFELVWRVASLPGARALGPGVHTGAVLAGVLAAGAFVYTIRNARAQEFLNDVAVELRKVSWPTGKETRQSTIVVIACVAVVGAILGLFDLVWSKLIKLLFTYGAT